MDVCPMGPLLTERYLLVIFVFTLDDVNHFVIVKFFVLQRSFFPYVLDL